MQIPAIAQAAAPGPAALDPLTAVTEKVRAVLREDGGLRHWGAEPPDALAGRGEPVAVTVLRGSGHAFVAFSSDGKPLGSHLSLLHVSVDGDTAAATECVLRLGRDDGRECPPAPFSLVDCATWSVPAGAARATVREARAALFVRIYEKQFIAGPSEEQEDVDDGGVEGGMIGGVDGGTTSDFVAVANVIESGKHRIRVSEAWAGYASADAAGRYARAAAASDLVNAAFERPRDAPTTPPPAVLHAEFSRLLAALPLDAQYWWWVRERMILMAGTLGMPADRARLEGYLAPRPGGPSELRTRSYALEALARRTGRDTRCEGTRRLDDATAAAAMKSALSRP